MEFSDLELIKMIVKEAVHEAFELIDTASLWSRINELENELHSLTTEEPLIPDGVSGIVLVDNVEESKQLDDIEDKIDEVVESVKSNLTKEIADEVVDEIVKDLEPSESTTTDSKPPEASVDDKIKPARENFWTKKIGRHD